MTLPEFSKVRVEDYRDQNEIIRLTAEQVIKDFALFGIEVKFSGSITGAYDELFEQLDSILIDLLNSDYRKLLALLYHIDLSEKELNDRISSHQGGPSEIITEMVLERELKKVLIRKFYKT
ncbi:MAG: hypothetical protein EA408_01315 [Marinilabiliales bacterium]|nr:MAG: hypothetical protein EA408_01315 [Marinilabiliales bacterium]